MLMLPPMPWQPREAKVKVKALVRVTRFVLTFVIKARVLEVMLVLLATVGPKPEVA